MDGHTFFFLMVNKHDNIMVFKQVITQLRLKIIYLGYQVKIKELF